MQGRVVAVFVRLIVVQTSHMNIVLLRRGFAMVTGKTTNKVSFPMILSVVCTLAFLVSTNVSAQLTYDRIDPSNRANNEDQTKRDPIRIASNIWWVGHSEVGAFLITTSAGLILMDTTSPEHAEWVVESIKKAGFKLEDIKYIINSHPHGEHIGGLSYFKKLLPGAKVVTSAGSAAIIDSGGKSDFRNMIQGEENSDFFEPVQVDSIIGHLEKLTLGDVTLIAHITSGHTPGATTWTMKVQDGGKEYNAVFMSGMSASGVDRGPLLKNELYPEIADDFEKSFAHLKTLQCDFYLYARASSIDLDKKLAQLKAGGNTVNPFIDPAGCKHFIDYYETRYKLQLEQEKAANM